MRMKRFAYKRRREFSLQRKMKNGKDANKFNLFDKQEGERDKEKKRFREHWKGKRTECLLLGTNAYVRLGAVQIIRNAVMVGRSR